MRANEKFRRQVALLARVLPFVTALTVQDHFIVGGLSERTPRRLEQRRFMSAHSPPSGSGSDTPVCLKGSLRPRNDPRNAPMLPSLSSK